MYTTVQHRYNNKNLYFCTGIHIVVLLYTVYFIALKKKCSRTTDEYVCSGVYVLSERWIFFLYWSCYLSTKNWRYLSVLEFIFLY